MQIVITGASRGIGAQLAQTYESGGAKVIATARDGTGDVALDVAKPQEFKALAEALDGAPVDLLVCNAGVYPDKGQQLDDGYPPQMWADAMAVNVTGVFLTIQTMLPNLRAAKGAKIAIISSQMASQTKAPGGSYIYRASKAAVLNLGRNLAQDLKADGIAVGIYHPGWVRTDMGGGQADIDATEAARGLSARFAALSMSSTGCFETWDGRAHEF